MVSHTKPLQPPVLLAPTVGLLDWRSAVHTSSLLPSSLSPPSLYCLSPSLLSSLSIHLLTLYSPHSILLHPVYCPSRSLFSFTLFTLHLTLYSPSPSLLSFSLSAPPSLFSFSLSTLILTRFTQPRIFQGEEIVSIHRTCDLELSSSVRHLSSPS